MIDSPWAQLIGLAMFPAVYLIGNIIQALVCAFLDVYDNVVRYVKGRYRGRTER